MTTETSFCEPYRSLAMALSDLIKDALKLQTIQGLHEKGLPEEQLLRVREAPMEPDG